MSAARAPRIYVLAGVNGAGKSSIAGAAFREYGSDYYNPDEIARALRLANAGMTQISGQQRSLAARPRDAGAQHRAAP